MIIDLFAGPGGWDEALRALGRTDVLGIEWDAAACATRRAVGHATLEADVAVLSPLASVPHTAVTLGLPIDTKVEGLIASPPCTAFSRAGKRHAIAHAPALAKAIRAGDWAARPDPDPTVWLVLEVGRWVEAIEPEWVACEQVPDVLPLWKAYRSWLEHHGYHAWCGVLSAEQYGVPQTRERALLLAHRRRKVGPPTPTHAKYDGRTHSRKQTETFEFLKPWVSMAEALPELGDFTHPSRTVCGHRGPRWAYDDPDGTHGNVLVQNRRGGDRLEEGRTTDEPSDAITSRADRWHVTFPGGKNGAVRQADEPAATVAFGHDATAFRVGFPRLDDRGDSEDGYRERDWRDGDEPAFALTEKARSWVVDTHTNSRKVAGDYDDWQDTHGHYTRSIDAPAPTLDRKAGTALEIVPEPEGDPADLTAAALMLNTGRDWKEGGTRDDAQKIPLDGPSPTLSAKAGGQWFFERPATTVAGDARLWPPGHKVNGDDIERLGEDGALDRYQQRRGEEAIRLSVQDALVLQSFPRDYPVQGNKTKQFEQVGNAIPPLLARAVLEVVL